MRQIWTDEKHCTLDGVPFEYGAGDYDALRTTMDKVWVLKTRHFFDRYADLLGATEPKRVLEIGFFEGGSGFLFADRWPAATIVAADLRAPNAAVPQLAERFGFTDRLSFHYEIGQDDPRILSLTDERLGGHPDLVIDDASHQYKLTRKTFEMLWPRVAPGGYYVVEDWAWAHWAPYQNPEHSWSKLLAPTNLLFEIIMAAGTTRACIADIHVEQNFYAVRRGPGTMPEPFSLSDHYVMRGKSFPFI